MQIVYVMEVIDPVERHGGARCVRRLTYGTREEAWTKYREAIRFGFEAYVEEVRRTHGVPTSSHERVARSSAAASRSARGGHRARTTPQGPRSEPGGDDAFSLRGSTSP